MTTFKEYASEHPTIQIDERLNDMEIPDDVRELLELHTQFDENVVDEFEMGDCTYARATYFDDNTVGVVATTGGVAPVEVVGLFGDKPVFHASAPDTYTRKEYDTHAIKGWAHLRRQLNNDVWETVDFEHGVATGRIRLWDDIADYDLARNVTFEEYALTPEERVNQLMTLGQVVLDAHYRIQQHPELSGHRIDMGIDLGLPNGISRASVDSTPHPGRYDCKRSAFRIIADVKSVTNELVITRVEDVALPVGVKVLTDADEDAIREFISDAVSDIVNKPITDIISDLEDTNNLTQ